MERVWGRRPVLDGFIWSAVVGIGYRPPHLMNPDNRCRTARSPCLVFDLYIVPAVMVLLPREVTMAPYSMDLRERVARAWDASGDAEEVAATFGVSRAWVHRLVQRRRETGSIAPRQQTKFRSRVLGRPGRAAGGPDRRASRRDVGGTPGGVADDGGAEHAVAGNRSAGPDR